MEKAELKRKLEASLEYLRNELNHIRTGRVTPSLLDNVSVDAYGSKMSIKELGTVGILDPQTLQVSPWDKSLLEVIASAIRNSDLKINPAVRNDFVVVPVPPLSEERRVEFAKVASAKVEDVKNSIRGTRQEAMKDIESKFASKEFGEDEKYTLREEVEATVKEYVKKADELGETKKTEIMTVGS